MLRSQILANYCKCSAAEIHIGHEAHGRPIINTPANLSSLSFNDSNCINAYALAVCRTARVGLDIEADRSVPERAAWDAAFCENELNALRKLPGEQRATAALRLWVRKEAILKSWGTGLAFPPTQINLSAFVDADCTGNLISVGKSPVTFRDLELPEGFIGCTALWNCSSTIRTHLHGITV